MRPQRRKSFWRRCRRAARWCRIASLALALLLLGCFLYFNLIGIPDFLKRPLLAGLRERGIELEFSRLRFRWFAGLVAESVTFAGTQLAEGPELSASEVAVQLNYRALARLRLEVESLTLQQGRLVLPLADRDQRTRDFTIDEIRTILRFLPGDRWELDQFRAVALGGELNVIGSLTNATAIGSWRSASTSTNRPAWPWRTHLRHIIRTTQDMQFGRVPQIILNLRGDAAEPSSILADINFNGADARTRWGHLDRFLLVGRLNRPAGSNDLGHSELRVQIEGADTPWGDISSASLHIDWLQSVTNPIPARVDWNWRFEEVSFPWGRIPAARFKGQTRQIPDLPDRLLTEFTLDSGTLHTDWIDCRTNQFALQTFHATDNYLPLAAAWHWTVEYPQSRWGGMRQFALDGTFERPDSPPPADTNTSANWWNHLRPFQIRWTARLAEAAVTNLLVDAVRIDGHWSWPHLAVDDLQLTIGDQELRGLAEANVISGGLQAAARSNLDPSRVAPLLPASAQNWIASLQWSQPPEIEAQASLPLEPWTDGPPDWRPALRSVEADATFRSRGVSWRSIEFAAAEGRLRRLPDRWEIAGLKLDRPEGPLELPLASILTNGTFKAQLHSRIDPLVLRPLAGEKPDEAFEILQFNSPPDLHAELSGRLNDPATLTGHGRLEVTNFVLRGEPLASLSASLSLTNRFLTATNVQLRLNDTEFAAADILGFDLPTTILHLTNATAHLLPSRAAPLISPNVGRIVSPYRFAFPADIRANGWVEVRRGRLADMWFDIAGGPFRYWRFNLPRIQSTLHWVDETVTLTNLSSPFYGGQLDGDMFIDFTGKRDPVIRFDTRVQTCDLRALISDLASPTNKLEGTLSGRWTVTDADTADWNSWNGHGHAELLDGYLWDIPLFGMFTPLLNAIIPGMGNSRFSGGTADFTMTNSVFHTKNLELRSPLMRLEYDGTIDFEGNVDAVVEARLLRDAWVVGPLVSFVFKPLTKLFEFHVTGTLNHLDKEPLYIPKPLLLPLQPFKLLRDIFSGPKKKTPDSRTSDSSPPPPTPPPADEPP